MYFRPGVYVPNTGRYVEHEKNDKQPSPAKRHVDLVAESVGEAIRTSKPLRVASTGKPAVSCRPFVGLQNSRL